MVLQKSRIETVWFTTEELLHNLKKTRDADGIVKIPFEDLEYLCNRFFKSGQHS